MQVGVVVDGVDQGVQPLLERGVGVDPGGGDPGLPGGLLGVGVQPVPLDRPGPDDRLPEQVGQRPVAERGQPVPPADRRGPLAPAARRSPRSGPGHPRPVWCRGWTARSWWRGTRTSRSRMQVVQRRRGQRELAPVRRPPRSARSAGSTGRTRSPRRPWPSPCRRSAGTGPRTRCRHRRSRRSNSASGVGQFRAGRGCPRHRLGEIVAAERQVGPVHAEGAEQLGDRVVGVGRRRAPAGPAAAPRSAASVGDRPLASIGSSACQSTASPPRSWVSSTSRAGSPAGSTNSRSTAASASYPVVPAHAQDAGSVSSPSRIFSTSTYRPPVSSARSSRYPPGSARPSGWSMRSPSTQPRSSHRPISACDAANTSGSSTRIAGKVVDREEPAVVQLGVGAAVVHQLVVLTGLHLARGAVAGARGDREPVVVVAQLAVLDPQRVQLVVPVAEDRQPDLARRRTPSRCRSTRRERSPGRAVSTSHHHTDSCGVATPTWLGTMSTSTPRPAPCAASATSRKPASPPRLGVHLAVVDDVVAVPGPGLGRQHRGQVHPVDAERRRYGTRPAASARSSRR